MEKEKDGESQAHWRECDEQWVKAVLDARNKLNQTFVVSPKTKSFETALSIPCPLRDDLLRRECEFAACEQAATIGKILDVHNAMRDGARHAFQVTSELFARFDMDALPEVRTSRYMCQLAIERQLHLIHHLDLDAEGIRKKMDELRARLLEVCKRIGWVIDDLTPPTAVTKRELQKQKLRLRILEDLAQRLKTLRDADPETADALPAWPTKLPTPQVQQVPETPVPSQPTPLRTQTSVQGTEAGPNVARVLHTDPSQE